MNKSTNQKNRACSEGSGVSRIFYFSGTGNGLAAAKQLSGELDGAEIVPVTKELVDAKQTIECDKCVLIFPVYGYGPPILVRKFLKNAEFKCGYFAALATCGTKTGGALGAVKTLLKRKGQKLDYALPIQTVENFVHFFGFPKEAVVISRTDSQRTKIKIAAEMIKSNGKNKTRSFRPFSRTVSILFGLATRNLFCRRYRVLDTCVSCGMCEKICSAEAITMRDGRPVFNKKLCDHCQGCMNLCPTQAIKFWKIKPGSQRYVHPEVKLDEFIKR